MYFWELCRIAHRGMTTLWRRLYFLSSRSTCERLHVGCVMVSSGEHKNRIIAAGYNGHLPGVPHVSCVRDGHEQATVHAEQNAICDARSKRC